MTCTTVMVVDVLTPIRPIERIEENFRGYFDFLEAEAIEFANFSAYLQIVRYSAAASAFPSLW